MKKKIFFGILGFSFLIWLYFYIFPMYKDFWIEESYFETRHYDKEYNSDENGFLDIENFLEFIDSEKLAVSINYYDYLRKMWWVEDIKKLYQDDKLSRFVINSLDFLELRSTFDKKFLVKVDAYHNNKDYYKSKNLNEELEKLEANFFSQEELTLYNEYMKKFNELESFLLDSSNFYKTQGFAKLLFIYQKYFNIQERVLSKEYMSSFDKWNELENSLNITNFIKVTRIMKYVSLYYIEEGNEKKWVEVFTNNNNFIVELLEEWDFKLIEVMTLRTLLNINLKNLDYIIENYNLSNENKDFIKQDLLSIDIDKKLYNNAFKREYQFMSEVLFDRFFWELEIKKVFIHKLFYSQKDTLNLLKKMYYQLVENWEIDLQIKRNGSNFLWRTLLQSSYSISYDSQYEKIDQINELKQSLLKKLEN